MIKHPDSHVDHSLTEDQLRYLLGRFADRQAFFLETIELPEELGTVPCGLWGPLVGDPPVDETCVQYAQRGTRTWTSRMVDRLTRPTRLVSVIAGPHEPKCSRCGGTGECVSLDIPYGARPMTYSCSGCAGTGTQKLACMLYTAFGGPIAPQEPGDPGCKDPVASAAFWREHALAK